MRLLCSNRLEVEELDSSNSNNSSNREQEMEMGTKWEMEIIIVEDRILEKEVSRVIISKNERMEK